ncbi:olfactory receptor 52A1-like [Rhinophrynus dorsalis]
MTTNNITKFYPTCFTLVGIPGLETAHGWISMFVFTFYVINLLGNMILITVISASPKLHEPMFIFLSMMAANDLLLPTSIAPKMLSIFWFNSRHIQFNACLLQMFFLHSLTSFESGLLLAMAYDRYIAICKPLRYASIITSRLIVKVGILLIARAIILMAPSIILIKLLHSFKTNVIAHSYCEHMAVVKLSADDIRVNSAYGLMVAFTIVGFDVTFISLSYIMIFYAIFRFPSKEARLKASGTCTPHICIFLSFYTLAMFSFLSHRYGKRIPPHIHIILSDLYILVPSMLNPLIYGMKMKLICEQIWKMFCKQNQYHLNLLY